MSKLLNVTSSPHIRHEDSTRGIMIDVIIALLPAAIYGCILFGLNAALVIITTVITAVASEALWNLALKKQQTIGDFSAVLTGLLLGMNLSSQTPLWIAAIGSVGAIIVVKQMFGGLGQNFMNPALAARCFLLISFTGRMTTFVYDGVTGATPLALLKYGENVNLMDMLIGNEAGTIGETSMIAILIGACILLYVGAIDLKIPGSYLVTFVIFLVVFSGRGFDLTYISAQLAGGGLMLGAFFMLTDYTTSPMTKQGQIIYAVLAGLITTVIRLYGGYPEGVSYSILFVNVMTPIIDKYTKNKVFGEVSK